MAVMEEKCMFKEAKDEVHACLLSPLKECTFSFFPMFQSGFRRLCEHYPSGGVNRSTTVQLNPQKTLYWPALQEA